MDVLKTASRISHLLVKESNATEITEMKMELQTLKDGLTKTFRGLVEKANALQSILPTVESLTVKALVVEQLAQKGENLLESNQAANINRKESLVALKVTEFDYNTNWKDASKVLPLEASRLAGNFASCFHIHWNTVFCHMP